MEASKGGKNPMKIQTIGYLIAVCFLLTALIMISVSCRVGPIIRDLAEKNKILADRNSRLMGFLIQLEWHNGGHCLFCGSHRDNGHYPLCHYYEIGRK